MILDFAINDMSISDPEREVFVKDSAEFYAQVAKSNVVPGNEKADDEEDEKEDEKDNFLPLGLSLILTFLLFV